MKECFTRALGNGSSRLMPPVEKVFGPMQDFLKDTPVNNEDQARLERQKTAMETKMAVVETKLMELRAESEKKGLEVKMVCDNVDKCRRLRDEIQH